MRLTVINQYYKPDLSAIACLAASLAEHRARVGDDVTVVTGGVAYVAARTDGTEAASDNPRICPVWTPRLGKETVLRRCLDYGSFYSLAAARMLTLPRQDAIVAMTTPPFIAWTGAFHRGLHPETKLILWNMDCYPEMAERFEMLKPGGMVALGMRRINRALFRRLDHLVCLDEAMAEWLISTYGPADRQLAVTVIPNWEEEDVFPADLVPEPWAAARDLDLDGKFVVLYLGNAGFGHQFDTALAAMERLRDEPVVFLFVGGGARWPMLQAAKQQRGLDNLVLWDYVPKSLTPSVMASADCALITLHDAILGLISPSKLHSNLAMRLPVVYIGPKGGNVDVAVERFNCGVSLRHGQIDVLVDFVRKLAGDAKQLQEYRARARKAFEDAYCDTRTLPKFDQVLRDLTR